MEGAGAKVGTVERRAVFVVAFLDRGIAAFF
jgi:hypothetical protein